MIDREPLSGKLAEVYAVIRRLIRVRGRPLTLDEIAAGAGLYDRSHARKYVRQLEEVRYVRQLDGHQGVELAEGSGLLLPVPALAAAGKPVATITPENGYFNFNEAFGGENNIMLQVRGTSMIEDQIADGDYIIVQQTSSADDGDKVVVRVGDALTLKKLRRIDGEWWLYPCNKRMKPKKCDGEMEIVGVFVGLVRKER